MKRIAGNSTRQGRKYLNSLGEIASLLGTLSIAVMSISVATYALAVPRLQTALTTSIKANRDSKAKLEKKIQEAPITLNEIEDQLKAIEREQTEIRKVISRLSWRRVVLIPTSLASVALGLDALLMMLSSIYDPLLLVLSIALLSGGFLHLLLSLNLIEETAVRPGLNVES